MTLSEGWKSTVLGSVLERVTSPVSVEPSRAYRQIGIRSHGKGIFHKKPVTGDSLGEKRVFWVVPDALVLNIVFAWEQAVAVTSEEETGMIASHRFPMYLPKDDLCDTKFLLQYFKTPRGKDLLEIASPGGAGRNRTLGHRDFEKLRLSMPNRMEQTRIARAIAVWDSSINVAKSYLAKTIELRDGLIRLLLTQRTRIPGYAMPWKTRRVNSMGEIISGGTPDTAEPKNWGGSTHWATPSDIARIRGRYIKDTERQITEQGLRESAARLLPPGSLLVCTRATICELAIASTTVATNQGFKNIVPSKHFDPEFLFHLFRFNKRRFVRLACGSTFLELGKRDFARMEFSVPDRDEQTEIAKRINAIDDQISGMRESAELLHTQKRLLMQQLLTGKRRLLRNNLDSEVVEQ